MKRAYIAPDLEVERYELNTSIAANCSKPVSLGPEIGDHQACDEYKDIWGIDEFSIGMLAVQKSFYDDGTCECYYSSSGEGLFTS